MSGNIYSVSQINRYIKFFFDKDTFLSRLFVEGEISNFKQYPSGHLYFTLKDKAAQINCVMFSSYAADLKFEPSDGMKVTVMGSVSLYEKTGACQLYIKLMEPAGLGVLYLAYEQLKEKLGSKGYFDEERKKPIPAYPKTIAVVTSALGAAVRDIISIAGRRNPGVELVVVPVQVQGEGAAETIAAAINDVNRWKGCDVMIVGRGGGSIEDLWAFNEEIVAEAVFRSKIPVVSAVGHETDYTIIDFVADLRAATPSAAAELLVAKRSDLIYSLNGSIRRLNDAIEDIFYTRRSEISQCIDFFTSTDRIKALDVRKKNVELIFDQMTTAVDNKLNKRRAEFEKAGAVLQSLSPLKVLERGYAVIKKENGETVCSAAELDTGEKVEIRFKDSAALAVIGDKYGEKNI